MENRRQTDVLLQSLSKIYAGTGALKSSFTRHGKMSLAGAIADARKSATRIYINNFADKGRQNNIDMLLVSNETAERRKVIRTEVDTGPFNGPDARTVI